MRFLQHCQGFPQVMHVPSTESKAANPTSAAESAATAPSTCVDPTASASPAGFYRPDRYSIEDSVGYLMKRVMNSVVAQADRQLAGVGLTNTQWGPLMRQRLAGDQPVAELARWLQVDAGATTRLLDRLEKKGLVRRERTLQDRRVVRVAITSEGMAATAQVPSVLSSIMNAHLGGFTHDEWQTLVGLLRRMLDNGEGRQGDARHEV